jgi:hypothetical protein
MHAEKISNGQSSGILDEKANAANKVKGLQEAIESLKSSISDIGEQPITIDIDQTQEDLDEVNRQLAETDTNLNLLRNGTDLEVAEFLNIEPPVVDIIPEVNKSALEAAEEELSAAQEAAVIGRKESSKAAKESNGKSAEAQNARAELEELKKVQAEKD